MISLQQYKSVELALGYEIYFNFFSDICRITKTQNEIVGFSNRIVCEEKISHFLANSLIF